MSLLRRILPPTLLTLWLFGWAVWGVSARYAPDHAVMMLLLWALAAAALHSFARLAAVGGPWIGRLGALPVGWVAVAHLREQTFRPESWIVVGLLVLVVAWIYADGTRRLAPPPRALPALMTGLVVVVGFGGVFSEMFYGSEVLRWHLLRHNTLLGTPAYYTLATPVLERQEALFEHHGAEPPESTPRSAAAPTPTEASDEGTAPSPNLVFVLLDTLRADALAAWGGDPEQMPRLNELLEGSYRFTDVWANSSWTRPSMVSFFTGLLPEEHGARDIGHEIPRSLVLLPEVLQERGYATAAFLTNVAALGEITGFDQGFDRFHEFGLAPYARAEDVGRTVERWLETPEAPREGLFLYVHYLDPHEPYLAGGEPTHKSPAQYRDAYRRELTYLDEHLMSLIDTLRQELTGSTVFLIASDHGEEFGEHELYGHGQSLYGELIDVPVALWTGDGGGTVNAPLEARDFFDLMVRLGSGEDVSVTAWADRHARDHRYASVYYSREGRLALRPYLRRVVMRAFEDGDRKLIWSAYGDTRELYDLSEDPGETFNRLLALPSEADRLTSRLDDPVSAWIQARELEPTGENLEQLRALGYVD